VVVDDFNVVGITVPPGETDPPTLVDADAVLACPVAGQLLQAIARGNTQVIEALGVVDHAKLPVRQLLDVGGKTRGPLPGEDMSGLPIPDRLDHDGSI
jgi:hypothetical protein